MYMGSYTRLELMWPRGVSQGGYMHSSRVYESIYTVNNLYNDFIILQYVFRTWKLWFVYIFTWSLVLFTSCLIGASLYNIGTRIRSQRTTPSSSNCWKCCSICSCFVTMSLDWYFCGVVDLSMSAILMTSFRFGYSSGIYKHEVGENSSMIRILPSILFNSIISTERYTSIL